MRSVVVSIAVFIGLSCSASADLVGLYNFTGLADVTDSVTGTPSVGVTLSALTRGSGLTGAPATDGFNSTGWTMDSSPDLSDYFEFTITPLSVMTLSRLSFNERRSPPDGILEFQIRSNLDGYTAAIPGTVTTVPDNPGARSQSFVLPLSFTSLTSATTFRIYGYNSETADGPWRLENYTGNVGTQGGLTIEGLAAIPEPGAIFFGGLVCCAIGLTAARRRIMTWFFGTKPMINN